MDDGKKAADASDQARVEKASVGRIVHYVNAHGEHLAALMVGVDAEKGTANLHVFPDSDPARNSVGNISGVEEGSGLHTWHWPERK